MFKRENKKKTTRKNGLQSTEVVFKLHIQFPAHFNNTPSKEFMAEFNSKSEKHSMSRDEGPNGWGSDERFSVTPPETDLEQVRETIGNAWQTVMVDKYDLESLRFEESDV